MSSQKDMYSIGQLSAMSSATAKQLRYLEGKGLLLPKRNLSNNYRYYSNEELNKLAYIKNLRNLGFSFDDVVSILKSKDNNFFLEKIKMQIDIAEEEINNAIATYSRMTSYYTQLLKSYNHETEISLMNKSHLNRIEIIDVPFQTVISIRRKASATSERLFINRFFELQKLCADKKQFPTSSMIAIFHDGWINQFESVAEDLETMFPIPGEFLGGPDTRCYGGFRAVTGIHIGDYKEMKNLYLRIFKFAEEEGVELMEVSAEEYLLGPDMTSNPQKYITRLYLPVKGSKI